MHKLKYQYPRIGIIVCALFLAVGLTACGGEENVDLQTYVSEVKARQKSRIPPLPKPQTFEVFTYNDGGLRDPFVPTVEILAIESDDGLKPDMDRERDVLEQYAVGSLKMMGILEKNGRRWALVRASDGTLHRTKTGRHLGKNNGEIVSITESQLELKEIVPDGLGGWMERMTTLAVGE
ncbi:MAG: pilus assembly protein PilP [Gammaproteobacteria bacterium]|nr:pilus assembly protein PilP [Gammaproteobacteria bacterium]MCF6261351.1 pilus assembly protein PilP [Gammaproteobacteria bacterium]